MANYLNEAGLTTLLKSMKESIIHAFSEFWNKKLAKVARTNLYTDLDNRPNYVKAIKVNGNTYSGSQIGRTIDLGEILNDEALETYKTQISSVINTSGLRYKFYNLSDSSSKGMGFSIVEFKDTGRYNAKHYEADWSTISGSDAPIWWTMTEELRSIFTTNANNVTSLVSSDTNNYIPVFRVLYQTKETNSTDAVATTVGEAREIVITNFWEYKARSAADYAKITDKAFIKTFVCSGLLIKDLPTVALSDEGIPQTTLNKYSSISDEIFNKQQDYFEEIYLVFTYYFTKSGDTQKLNLVITPLGLNKLIEKLAYNQTSNYIMDCLDKKTTLLLREKIDDVTGELVKDDEGNYIIETYTLATSIITDNLQDSISNLNEEIDNLKAEIKKLQSAIT